jgi:hypothetical protein
MVKETPLLPRKPLSAPERHLHPQALQKGYKTQSPTRPTEPPVSGSPCIPHYAVFLFSTNKIFLTSAALVHLCFHSQSRLKNPEYVKFLHVISASTAAFLWINSDTIIIY